MFLTRRLSNAKEASSKLRLRCANYSIRGEEKGKVALIRCNNQEAESEQMSDHVVAVPEDRRGKFKHHPTSTADTRS